MAEVRPMDPRELPRVAAFVAALQADPEHHLGEFASDPAAIAQQLREFEPAGLASLHVASDGDELVGVLQAEWDTEPPRVWWQGPMVRPGHDWQAVADALYDTVRAVIPDGVTQEELAPDQRNVRVARFARRHGFAAEVASAVLARTLSDPLPPSWPVGVTVNGFVEEDRADLAALHDGLFPATHTTGARLDEGTDRIVLTARADGRLVGYVAAEVQEEGDGYLDFLGVAPAARRRGIARSLVAAACGELLQAGSAAAHLTVREDNAAARRLYASLGFVEERILVPWRRGFSTA